MNRRWLPSPPLSAALFVVWLLLNQTLDIRTLVSAALLAIVVPLLTKRLRPEAVRMRQPGIAVRLMAHAMLDMVRSALRVCRLLLTHSPGDINPQFVHVPLDLRDPNALAVLAMICCLTPGTAWAELSLDRSSLLLHVFDLQNEEAFIQFIKQRYEQPLQEIFEP